jgi:hypothetical protein
MVVAYLLVCLNYLNAASINVFRYTLQLILITPFLTALRVRLCENVASEDESMRNTTKKCSLCMINEHFELNYNAEALSALVFTQSGANNRGFR